MFVYSLPTKFLNSGEFLIVNDVPKSVKIPTGKLTVEGDANIVVENNTDNNNANTNNNIENNIEKKYQIYHSKICKGK